MDLGSSNLTPNQTHFHSHITDSSILSRQDQADAVGSWNHNRSRSWSRSPRKCNPQTPLSLLPPMLSADKGKHTLVLDMDGTLLHECLPSSCIPHDVDFVLRRKLTGAQTFVLKRPGLEEFLLLLRGLYEIVIFTESSKQRADVILDRLHNSKCIRHRLYRDSCTEVDGRLAKDLSRLGRDLRKVVIVDDCPFSSILQPFNALPIPWFDATERNNTLPHIYSVLLTLSMAADIRVALSQKLRDGSYNDLNQTYHMNGALVITHENVLHENVLTIMGPLLFPMNSCDDGKHTLVLDLDETLLFECPHKLDSWVADFAIQYPTEITKRYVYIRPGVQEFLARMEKLFEIVLFTASGELRANSLLQHLDGRECIRFRLFRTDCLALDGKIVKDVSRLGRDVRKVIIVDDTPAHFELQPFNGIPIKSFRGDPSDRQLRELIPFLEQLRQQEDVRPLIETKYHHDEVEVIEESQ